MVSRALGAGIGSRAQGVRMWCKHGEQGMGSRERRAGNGEQGKGSRERGAGHGNRHRAHPPGPGEQHQGCTDALSMSPGASVSLPLWHPEGCPWPGQSQQPQPGTGDAIWHVGSQHSCPERLHGVGAVPGQVGGRCQPPTPPGAAGIAGPPALVPVPQIIPSSSQARQWQESRGHVGQGDKWPQAPKRAWGSGGNRGRLMAVACG